MLNLSTDVIVLLTIIAAFSQSIVLAIIMIVIYKNFIVLKKHNEMTAERLDLIVPDNMKFINRYFKDVTKDTSKK